jgi:hypothetical protein
VGRSAPAHERAVAPHRAAVGAPAALGLRPRCAGAQRQMVSAAVVDRAARRDVALGAVLAVRVRRSGHGQQHEQRKRAGEQTRQMGAHRG